MTARSVLSDAYVAAMLEDRHQSPTTHKLARELQQTRAAIRRLRDAEDNPDDELDAWDALMARLPAEEGGHDAA